MQGALGSADPLNLSEIPESSSEIHVLLIRLKRLMDAELTRTLEVAGGLRVAEWRILFVLSRDGPLAQKHIANWIIMEQGQASRVLRAMQRKGLVRVDRDRDDRRSWKYRLTPAGRKLFERVNPVMQKRRRALDRVFAPAEMQRFRAMMTQIACNLSVWEAGHPVNQESEKGSARTCSEI